jgi:hypothetical protein
VARAPQTGWRGRDSGTAIVGTLVGFAIFMLLLLLAVQVAVRLYATSAITAAAESAASQVASAPVPAAEVPAAEGAARARLGGFGAEHTRFDWLEVDANQVVLEVTAEPPSFLPGLSSWGAIRRTVTVRTERFR